MKPLRALIACEFSGIVRDAFSAQGWDAWSCDLLPSEKPGQHVQCDVFELLARGDRWDLLGFHWPCTYLCRSGQQWLTRLPKKPKPTILYGAERMAALLEHAHNFNRLLAQSKIPYIYGENPMMNNHARKIVRPSDQKIQPFQFGHGEQKETHLWLKNLPLLVPTNVVEGREQRIFRLSPGANRWKERSLTFPGIAQALATQWAQHIRISSTLHGKQMSGE